MDIKDLCSQDAPHPVKKARMDLGNNSKQDNAKSGISKSDDDIEIQSLDAETSVEEPPPISFVPLNSLPPAQAAFSIEKIRKIIFSYSTPQDLLRFRLVCRAWRCDAINEQLLSWDKNTIRIGRPARNGRGDESYHDYDCSDLRVYARNSTWINKKSKRPLQELKELMDETGSNPFPCSHFRIYYNHAYEGEEALQTFLTEHGARIKKLELKLLYCPYCFEGWDEDEDENEFCLHIIPWLIKFFTKLLLEQTTNLADLEIDFEHRLNKIEIPCTSVATNNDNENIPKGYHSKLQSAKWKLLFIQPVIEFFCQIAPNLNDLRTVETSFYLQPKNRLYLLKELMFNPGYDAEDDEVVQRISNMEDDLSLKKLYYMSEYIHTNPEQWIGIAETLNKILKKSCHSLEELHWVPVGFLPGLDIPVMPKVKYIELQSSRDAYDDDSFFPPGIRVSVIFPNLQVIRLHKHLEKDICKYNTYLFGCENEVMPSVKTIIRDPVRRSVRKYSRWFPNAVIKEFKYWI